MPTSHCLPDVAGVTHRSVHAAGVRLHVAEIGDGPAVVLIHDWGQHWFAWRHVMAGLAADHHVIAIDLRGSGWSEAPAGGYTTAEGVSDLLAAIDALGLDAVTVVGHGWGGTLAMHLAIAHPDRVTSLVVAGTAGPWVTAASMLRHAWWYATTIPYETPLLGRWVARRCPWLLCAVLRRSAHDRSSLTTEILHCYARVLQERPRAVAAEKVQRHRGYGEVVPTLLGKYRRLRLTVPTTMLVGSGDPGLSAAACRTALPHAPALQVHTIPGCGHLVPEECPEAVIHAVREPRHQ